MFFIISLRLRKYTLNTIDSQIKGTFFWKGLVFHKKKEKVNNVPFSFFLNELNSLIYFSSFTLRSQVVHQLLLQNQLHQLHSDPWHGWVSSCLDRTPNLEFERFVLKQVQPILRHFRWGDSSCFLSLGTSWRVLQKERHLQLQWWTTKLLVRRSK